MKFSPLLSDLIKSLQVLPGVGPKTAKRMAMSLLGGDEADAKNLANNQRPDGKALLDHLKTIHQHNAGFTEKCASTCRDRSGRNSYEWLAEAVPDINGTRVLDLACGSGPLLKRNEVEKKLMMRR